MSLLHRTVRASTGQGVPFEVLTSGVRLAFRCSPFALALRCSFTPINHVARTRLGGSCVAQHLVSEPLVLVQGVVQRVAPTLALRQAVRRVIAVRLLVFVERLPVIARGHLGAFEVVHCSSVQGVLRRLFRGPRLAVQVVQLPACHFTEVLSQLGLLGGQLLFPDPGAEVTRYVPYRDLAPGTVRDDGGRVQVAEHLARVFVLGQRHHVPSVQLLTFWLPVKRRGLVVQ